MESIWEVDYRNFPAFVAAREVALLYVWAGWYSGDGYMRLRVQQVSRSFPRVNIGVMDVDPSYNWNLTKILGINEVPSVMFFVRGSRKIVLRGPSTYLELTNATKAAIYQSNKIDTLRERFRQRTGNLVLPPRGF